MARQGKGESTAMAEYADYTVEPDLMPDWGALRAAGKRMQEALDREIAALRAAGLDPDHHRFDELEVLVKFAEVWEFTIDQYLDRATGTIAETN